MDSCLTSTQAGAFFGGKFCLLLFTTLKISVVIISYHQPRPAAAGYLNRYLNIVSRQIAILNSLDRHNIVIYGYDIFAQCHGEIFLP